MTTGTCSHCNGAGVRKRSKEEDGAEGDPDMHPITAQTMKTCERCGGTGRVRLTQEEVTKLVG